MGIEESLIYIDLSHKNQRLSIKTLDLAKLIEKVLGLIPRVFPHFTDHSISHSEEILKQISLILYADNDVNQPKINLSYAELFVLICCALLHDVGMVITEEEEIRIINSKEWVNWISEKGPGYKKYSEINKISMSIDLDQETIKYIKFLNTRKLLSEFIRINHHILSSNIIRTKLANYFSTFFDDNIIIKTISDICESHGMSSNQLDDSEIFPFNRNILDQPVDVRLLCILLRIGDLLDISNERSCSVLLEFIKPFPQDSITHWSVSKRICHKSITPEIIEVSAECENIEEHRLLLDWFNHLSNEIDDSRKLLAKTTRHQAWKPPFISLCGDNQTIKITSAPNVKYIFNEWKIAADKDTITNLLIRSLNADKNAFIRELIQNSIDATKCKIITDHNYKQVDNNFQKSFTKDVLDNYQISISLEEKKIFNELLNDYDSYQVIRINDQGMGMDSEIIQKYFLQIGKSFYESEDFSKNYFFTPISSFGIGFLSTFIVSDRIVIETLFSSKSNNGESLKISINGIRNYFLVEKSDRKQCGTEIILLLNKGHSYKRGEFTSIIKALCKKVEIPILVSEFGDEELINMDNKEKYIFDVNVTSTNKVYSEIVNIDRGGITGEIILVKEMKEGNDLLISDIKVNDEITANPKNTEMINFCTDNYICFNGIKIISIPPFNRNLFYHLDVRNKSLLNFDINRLTYYSSVENVFSEIKPDLIDVLTNNFSKLKNLRPIKEFSYKERVLDYLTYIPNKIFREIILDLPNIIYYYFNGSLIKSSVMNFIQQPEFYVIYPNPNSKLIAKYPMVVPYHNHKGDLDEYYKNIEKARINTVNNLMNSPTITDLYFDKFNDSIIDLLKIFFEPKAFNYSKDCSFIIIKFDNVSLNDLDNKIISFINEYSKKEFSSFYYLNNSNVKQHAIQIPQDSIYCFILLNLNNKAVSLVKKLIDVIEKEKIIYGDLKTRKLVDSLEKFAKYNTFNELGENLLKWKDSGVLTQVICDEISSVLQIYNSYDN